MVDLARQDPAFSIITSLPNLNDTLTAQFIAETRGPARFTHFKPIETLAGDNLHLSESGQHRGARHISCIGNPRLRRILFQMTQQAVKAVPQVRCRFLKRQLKHKRYRKNIVAATSQLLRLIVAPDHGQSTFPPQGRVAGFPGRPRTGIPEGQDLTVQTLSQLAHPTPAPHPAQPCRLIHVLAPASLLCAIDGIIFAPVPLSTWGALCVERPAANPARRTLQRVASPNR